MDEMEEGKQKFLEVVKGTDAAVQVVIPVTPSNNMFLISLLSLAEVGIASAPRLKDPRLRASDEHCCIVRVPRAAGFPSRGAPYILLLPPANNLSTSATITSSPARSILPTRCHRITPC